MRRLTRLTASLALPAALLLGLSRIPSLVERTLPKPPGLPEATLERARQTKQFYDRKYEGSHPHEWDANERAAYENLCHLLGE